MEATKKKKAYLKPEMSRLEVKIEETCVTTSRGTVTPDVPEEFICIYIKNNAWLVNNNAIYPPGEKSGGAWSFIKDAKNYDTDPTPYDIGVTTKIDNNIPADVYQRGFNVGDCVNVKRLKEGCSTDYISISITLKPNNCN